MAICTQAIRCLTVTLASGNIISNANDTKSILLLPTLLDNYKLPPLTNKANLKDSTIIWASVLLTVLIQFSIRLMI
jgi:hypothetical protein